jgi:hypothetical protein
MEPIAPVNPRRKGYNKAPRMPCVDMHVNIQQAVALFDMKLCVVNMWVQLGRIFGFLLHTGIKRPYTLRRGDSRNIEKVRT